MLDVIALGELLIDFAGSGSSGQGNPLFEACPGGAPCNVLAMLAKLGRKTAFVGKVGNDLFGRRLRDTIAGAGISPEGLILDPAAHTTLAFVQNAPDGDREFSFYRDPGADELLTPEELPAALEEAAVFHFGSLSLTREPARSATRTAVERAQKAGAVISFDPNLRPSLWKKLDDAREEMLWGCSVCQVLKVAEEELSFLTMEEELDAGAAKLRERFPGIRLLLVTKGGAGSVAFWKGLRVEKPALPVTAIDTTGAGDTFCACCLHHVLEWGLDGFSEARLGEMLVYANAAAGLVTTKKGALLSMPAPEEVEALLSRCPGR